MLPWPGASARLALRIVSLLPSATEIVCALGLGNRLVGVSHECDRPGFVRGLPQVTRTSIPSVLPSAEVDLLVRERVRAGEPLYSLDRVLLERLRPDLILTQALCDVCAVAEADVEAAVCDLPGGARVLSLGPRTLAEVLLAMREVGAAAGLDERATDEVVRGLEARVEAVAGRSARLAERPGVALLEWLAPPFACGHWSPELVRLAGGEERLGREGEPSRALRWEEVAEARPEVVVAACCGLDVGRTLADVAELGGLALWRELPAVRAGRVFVLDGARYLSVPGPSLVDSLEILAHALHPDAHPLPERLPRPLCVTALAGP